MRRNKILFLFTLLQGLILSAAYSQHQDVKVFADQFIEKLNEGLTVKNTSLDKTIELKIIEKEIKSPLSGLPNDAFQITSGAGKIAIVALEMQGLKNGMNWYLYQLGYRYYFPNNAWHYIPRIKSVYISFDTVLSPSFNYRRIWYAYGTRSPIADKDYRHWVDANLLGGENVSAGHSYQAIIERNKKNFLENPQFFAQPVSAGTIPGNAKFEVGNEELVRLVIKDAFQQIETSLKKTGTLPEMISMDPSDGGGFSINPGSLKIGGPSEQTFYLANRVAKAVREKYPSVKIGLYAYNQHTVPPSFNIEKNIVVLIATAMNQSKYRTNELIELWKKKDVELGIRDYYGVMAWDWDMPGRPNGSKIEYVKKLIQYHQDGIKLFSAETNVGWISRGLGHYIAARLLWNIDENINKIKSDFFKNMFGKASSSMEELFDLWQINNQAIPSDADLKTWGLLIEKSAGQESDLAVQGRINQFKHYFHYLFLYKKWKLNPLNDNLVNLLSFAFRIQDEGSVASYPLFRRIASKEVAGHPHMSFKDANAVWKNNAGVITNEATKQFFVSDLAAINATPVLSLIKPLPQNIKINTRPNSSINETSPKISLRSAHKIIFYVSGEPASINISAGIIKATHFKSLLLTVFPYNKNLSVDQNTPLIIDTIQPGQPLKSISLKELSPGFYFAVINDAKSGFNVSFSGAAAYGIVAGNNNKVWSLGRNNLFFKVTNENDFTINNAGPLTLISPAGRTVDLQKQKGEFKINVLKNENGIWQIKNQSGIFEMTGIFPLLATSKFFLLNIE